MNTDYRQKLNRFRKNGRKIHYISNWLEREAEQRVTRHLSRRLNQNIDSRIFGVPDRGAEDALLEVLRAKDDGLWIGAGDIGKAFPSTSIKHVKHVLKELSIPISCFRWEFLINNRIFVPKHLVQGLSSSPFLFSLVLSDILRNGDSLKSQIIGYVDDFVFLGNDLHGAQECLRKFEADLNRANKYGSTLSLFKNKKKRPTFSGPNEPTIFLGCRIQKGEIHPDFGQCPKWSLDISIGIVRKIKDSEGEKERKELLNSLTQAMERSWTEKPVRTREWGILDSQLQQIGTIDKNRIGLFAKHPYEVAIEGEKILPWVKHRSDCYFENNNKLKEGRGGESDMPYFTTPPTFLEPQLGARKKMSKIVFQASIPNLNHSYSSYIGRPLKDKSLKYFLYSSGSKVESKKLQHLSDKLWAAFIAWQPIDLFTAVYHGSRHQILAKSEMRFANNIYLSELNFIERMDHFTRYGIKHESYNVPIKLTKRLLRSRATIAFMQKLTKKLFKKVDDEFFYALGVFRFPTQHLISIAQAKKLYDEGAISISEVDSIFQRLLAKKHAQGGLT